MVNYKDLPKQSLLLLKSEILGLFQIMLLSMETASTSTPPWRLYSALVSKDLVFI